MNSIFLKKIFLIIASLLFLVDSRIIQNGKTNLDTTSTGTFDDDAIRKNDDSHLRLFYKSNSPDRSISHEMEHRLLKNPSIQYMNQITPEYSFQKFPNHFSINYLDPRSNIFPGFKQNNDIFSTAKGNKQTLLNLHYHGNSIPGLDSTLNQISNRQNQHENEIQRKLQTANLLRMLLMKISPFQQMLSLTKNAQQPRYEQIPSKNDLKYKILNFKIKLIPDQETIYGHGYITDNDDNSFFKSKNPSSTRNIPEIIKRLMFNSQSIGNQNNEIEKTSFLKKRNDNFLKFSDESNFEKRDVDEKNQVKNEKEYFSNDEEKINENEFNESFKSLQRREDTYKDEDLNNLDFNSKDYKDSTDSLNDD